MKSKNVISLLFIFFLYTAMLEDVNAASISVKCETRGTSRSKISVDGAGLKGVYYAIVSSGTVSYRSKLPNKTATSSGEIEFDFDSNSSDIKAGATAIPATFIKGSTVYGYLRQSNNVLIGTMKAICLAK